MRRIKQTYEIITPESAAEGDCAESGWVNEEGAEIVPDAWDIEEWGNDYGNESHAAVMLAVKHLREHGAVEASSSQFHCGVWYSTIDAENDYQTGEQTFYSFHLEDFSPEEEQAIFNLIIGKENKCR